LFFILNIEIFDKNLINLNCLFRFIQNEEIIYTRKKMNDLVFVMCNLKLNDNQVKKQADDFGIEDDLSFDDDWIIEGEKHPNFDLLSAIDSATQRQNGDEEEIPNDVEMESHGIEDDLDIQIDDIGVGSSSSTNVHNIGVGTSSNTNNPFDANDIDECLRNDKEDEGNEVGFSLHDTPADCLF